jgi:hypothetical protein
VTCARLTILPGHYQQDEPSIPPRITRISLCAYPPAAADSEGNFCFVALPDRGKGDDHYFSTGGRLEALDQCLQRIHCGRGYQTCKVIDVADWPLGKQRVDTARLG